MTGEKIIQLIQLNSLESCHHYKRLQDILFFFFLESRNLEMGEKTPEVQDLPTQPSPLAVSDIIQIITIWVANTGRYFGVIYSSPLHITN
jgi:hypothetical protein